MFLVKTCLGVLVSLLLCFTMPLRAQTPTTVVNGQVRDTSGPAIPNATAIAINKATNVRSMIGMDDKGIYSVQKLPPGPYHIHFSKSGFKAIVHPVVTLHVQDAMAISFSVSGGPTADTVTLEGGVPLINTGSVGIGTAVDGKFVEDVRLDDGRSFEGDDARLAAEDPNQSAQVGRAGDSGINEQCTNYYTSRGAVDDSSISADTCPPESNGSPPTRNLLSVAPLLPPPSKRWARSRLRKKVGRWVAVSSSILAASKTIIQILRFLGVPLSARVISQSEKPFVEFFAIIGIIGSTAVLIRWLDRIGILSWPLRWLMPSVPRTPNQIAGTRRSRYPELIKDQRKILLMSFREFVQRTGLRWWQAWFVDRNPNYVPCANLQRRILKALMLSKHSPHNSYGEKYNKERLRWYVAKGVLSWTDPEIGAATSEKRAEVLKAIELEIRHRL